MDLSELFFNQANQLFLSFVRHFHVVNQLRELNRAVTRQHKSLLGLSEEVNELSVVSETRKYASIIRNSKRKRKDMGKVGKIG